MKFLTMSVETLQSKDVASQRFNKQKLVILSSLPVKFRTLIKSYTMPGKTKVYQPFQFKQFSIEQDMCAMKIGTDGVLLGAWCNTNNCKTALDIGTGTGVIAIMLAQRTQATIYGVEINRAAYEQAKNNMAISPWAKRLRAIYGDIQNVRHHLKPPFDLIVSNPPYFSGGTHSPNPQKNVVRHTITLTHSNLLRICSQLKSMEVAKMHKLFCTKITYVKSRINQKPERMLLQFEKNASNLKKENELFIYSGNNREYTLDYIQLTKDFYLNM